MGPELGPSTQKQAVPAFLVGAAETDTETQTQGEAERKRKWGWGAVGRWVRAWRDE